MLDFGRRLKNDKRLDQKDKSLDYPRPNRWSSKSYKIANVSWKVVACKQKTKNLDDRR